MSALSGKINMEDLNNEKYEISSKNIKKKTPKWKYYLIEWCEKLIFVGIGIFITVLLYQKCLFNPACNTIISIYFAVLGLACFAQAGLRLDKLANIKLI